jgi:hypothetical protein
VSHRLLLRWSISLPSPWVNRRRPYTYQFANSLWVKFLLNSSMCFMSPYWFSHKNKGLGYKDQLKKDRSEASARLGSQLVRVCCCETGEATWSNPVGRSGPRSLLWGAICHFAWGDGENKPLSVILGAVSSFPWWPFAYYRWFAAKNGRGLIDCCWGRGGTKGRIPGLSPNPKLRLLFVIPVDARAFP